MPFLTIRIADSGAVRRDTDHSTDFSSVDGNIRGGTFILSSYAFRSLSFLSCVPNVCILNTILMYDSYIFWLQKVVFTHFSYTLLKNIVIVNFYINDSIDIVRGKSLNYVNGKIFFWCEFQILLKKL